MTRVSKVKQKQAVAAPLTPEQQAEVARTQAILKVQADIAAARGKVIYQDIIVALAVEATVMDMLTPFTNLNTPEVRDRVVKAYYRRGAAR